MPFASSWVHGNIVRVGDVVAGSLLQVNNVGYSDIVGLSKGWGTIFRGRDASSIWFNIPIPTPVILPKPNESDRGIRLSLSKVFVFYGIGRGANILQVQLWDGTNGPLRINPPFPANPSDTLLAALIRGEVRNLNAWDINPRRAMQFGLGVSVQVNFIEETEITFGPAGADFEQVRSGEGFLVDGVQPLPP